MSESIFLLSGRSIRISTVIDVCHTLNMNNALSKTTNNRSINQSKISILIQSNHPRLIEILFRGLLGWLNCLHSRTEICLVLSNHTYKHQDSSLKKYCHQPRTLCSLWSFDLIPLALYMLQTKMESMGLKSNQRHTKTYQCYFVSFK